jgi:hypothetical protein
MFLHLLYKNKIFFKMRKILIILAILAVVLFGLFKFMQSNTKKASPEATANFDRNGHKMEVKYCSPSKKGRDIFGSLVPFGQVWRTGANEATTFETNANLNIAGQALPAGKYTLWTIPEQNNWTVIFSKSLPGWGVGFGGKAAYEPADDALKVTVPSTSIEGIQENFKIEFSQDSLTSLNLVWDKTKVALRISKN